MITMFRAGALACILGLATLTSAAHAASGTEPAKQAWSFNGPLGTYDRAALQRGYQIYKEGCAACHSMNQLYFRNLAALGFSEAEIKAIASEYTVMDGPNDQGEMFERPARPSDHFKSPFANEKAAAAANNGATPPDLSLITKARHGGPDYLYGLLTGYTTPPATMQMPSGMTYNKMFPGHMIAMPAPLSDGQVTFADNTPATVRQMARDVTTFLSWAAEPEMEARKRMGLKVMAYLLLLAGVMIALKKKVWSKVH